MQIGQSVPVAFYLNQVPDHRVSCPLLIDFPVPRADRIPIEIMTPARGNYATVWGPARRQVQLSR